MRIPFVGEDETTAGGRDASHTGFRLHEHPWLSVGAVLTFETLAIVLVILVFTVANVPESPLRSVLQPTTFHFLFIFLFAPYVLRLPSGRQPLSAYLDEIRLTRIRPLGRLFFLGLSCSLILVVSQAAGVLVYRLTLGEPLTAEFVLGVVDISSLVPPESWSLLVSLPSALEEVTFRGVLLFTLLQTFTKRKAVVVSAGAFGLIHLLNIPLGTGSDVVWVLGQVGWSFLIGLFYGYVVLRTDSLLPAMLVHYLGNAFVGSITWYVQATASVETQVLYGLVFSVGVIPVVGMTLWARYATARWFSTEQATVVSP
ncbi:MULTISPECIES: CPBP family intramembrane glutamic endopeptidase [Haloferax]|uniref:CPBP family intramembrane metalloprotease n=1 Tax=Haloferax marinum TaxID=2666143 RepID=A0A6A8G484_9EURY|nr:MULTISPECIES: type II CAAX endopeptidase family protein [Haloferax]KAB1196611.1 CPBP family intramembrane metalloprotease [Haloferax sp. CBA1150]MRW95615.1 CPBP family intramembrane metalloprotease [Haloferax marinum]